jgi:peroxiredoxin
MIGSWKLTVVLAVAVVLAVGSCGEAAKAKLGEPAPSWAGLIGIDDNEHALSDYQGAKLLVLVFTCNHCPVAVAYEDRLVQLQKDYQAKGVQIVAVNVNNIPQDRLEPMKERAKEKGFNFPYLYDSSQKIGRDYGAKNTPEVFVLDQHRRLVYHGGIDDNMRAEKVKTHALREALDALLAGKAPAKAETPHPGCGIKYE